MQLAAHALGSVLVVEPDAPRLDIDNADRFKSAVVDLIEEGHERLVLDLSHVGFIDSKGIGVLVSLLRSLAGHGDLVLTGVGAAVRKTLGVTRLDRVFAIYPDREAAKAHFTS